MAKTGGGTGKKTLSLSRPPPASSLPFDQFPFFTFLLGSFRYQCFTPIVWKGKKNGGSAA
jgi:hypothetical protein